MTTVTEYAIRYTGFKHGKIRTLVEELYDPTDYQEAKRVVEHTRSWQADADKRLKLAVDAEIVTRTVTASDWENEDVARSGRQAAEIAQASQFNDAVMALATFVSLWADRRKHDSDLAKSLLRYVLVDSRRTAAKKGTEIPDELWAWASDESAQLIETASKRIAAREGV